VAFFSRALLRKAGYRRGASQKPARAGGWPCSWRSALAAGCPALGVEIGRGRVGKMDADCDHSRKVFIFAVRVNDLVVLPVDLEHTGLIEDAAAKVQGLLVGTRQRSPARVGSNRLVKRANLIVPQVS
jgi:hypothetical protein